MSYAFNVLALLWELLKDQPGTVLTERPTDIAGRLPALVVGADGAVKIRNLDRPGHGATVQVVLTALAEDDETAFSLADSAYSAVYDKRHQPTRWGWVARVSEIQAPTLTPSDLVADGVYQYQAVLDLVIRK